VTVGELGVQYSYTATARDDDGDALTFSIVNGPAGMQVGGSTGKVTWMPSTAGNFPVALKVSDGMGGEALQEFTVAVSGPPAGEKPSVGFLSPSEGQKISGNFTLTGVVVKGGQEVTIVQVRVDNGEWMNASGSPGWQLTLDTTTLSNGNHTIGLRAFDGKDYSDPVVRTVNVDNTPPSRTVKNETSFTILDGLILLALFLALVALFYIRRK
jgi:hypothetical protein